MKKTIINIGDRYGELTLLKEVFTKKRRAFECKCDCGNIKTIILDNLRNGNSTTCGCGTYKAIKKHGLNQTRIYRIYYALNSRCNSVKHKAYKYYGGRGIINEWKTFEEFKNDMYESYLEHCKEFGEKETTIDRIDSNGSYNKDNCRWATIQEQNRNTRTKIIYKGKHIEEWIKDLGLNGNTVRTRLKRGWTFEKSLNIVS